MYDKHVRIETDNEKDDSRAGGYSTPRSGSPLVVCRKNLLRIGKILIVLRLYVMDTFTKSEKEMEVLRAGDYYIRLGRVVSRSLFVDLLTPSHLKLL